MAFNQLVILEVLKKHEDEIRRSFRRERVLRDPTMAFELSDQQFVRLFRLSRSLVFDLCDELGEALSGERSTSLPVTLKILIALRFFATGCYQMNIAQDFLLNVSQSTVSRTVKSVSQTIVDQLMDKWVNFPITEEQKTRIKKGFMESCQIPGVIGALDCTHVAVVSPTKKDEELGAYHFMNRKGFFSINVQLICDHEAIILNVNARYPGSTHDSFIWKNSLANSHLQQSHVDGTLNCSFLLADSGYPCQPWCQPPHPKPRCNSPESRFNDAHVDGRQIIERCNGILKQRFRCLLKDRVLHYCPSTAGIIINACCILHNMCKTKKVPEDFSGEKPLEADDRLFNVDIEEQGLGEIEGGEEEIGRRPGRNNNWHGPGVQVRNCLIRRFR